MSGTNPAIGSRGIQLRCGRRQFGAPEYRDMKLGSVCGNRQVRVGADLQQSLTRLAAAEPKQMTKGGHECYADC